MGVKNLLPLLRDLCPSIVTEVGITTLSGKTIGIDASTWLYQLVCAGKRGGSVDDDIIMLKGIYNRVVFLLKYSITPLFVFDGKPPSIKNRVLQERKKIKDNARLRLDNGDYEDEAGRAKLEQRMCSITTQQVSLCKKLLEHMGVPYVQAPEEADSQCAYMFQAGILDYVISEDSDVVVFGCDRVIRSFKASSVWLEVLDMTTFYASTGLTRHDLVDATLLLGCDYFPGVRGMGKARVGAMLKNKAIDTKGIEANVVVQAARQYYTSPPVMKDIPVTLLVLLPANKEKLIAFITSKMKMDAAAAQKYLGKLVSII